MKKIISYLYKINIINSSKYNDEIVYYDDNNNYYLYKEYTNNIKWIMYLYNSISYLNNYSFFAYNFKKNIYGDIVSIYNDKRFILIDIGTDFKKTIDIDDMLLFYRVSSKLLSNNIKYSNNWHILWEDKIDYLINHFNNNKLNNKNLSIIFYYYISIAENVLLYIIKISKNNNLFSNKVCFTHRRVIATKFDFYNPLNFIIDTEIRDIGEYIKRLFYINEDYENELHYYLKINKLNKYEASILYARIVYPSIFFDDYERNNVDYKKYIDFDKYKDFIKKIYDVITSYIYIDKIDWLY